MDELFNTTQLFTVSGNQKYTWKKFKVSELKGRLSFKEITRPPSHALQERQQKKGG